MADYHSPTVVQPDIPIADITPLERLVLCHMMQVEEAVDGLYLYAELSIDLMPAMPLDQLRSAYAASIGTESRILPYIGEILEIARDDDDAADIELNLRPRHDDCPFETILQDIIRRSASVAYFTVSTAFVCSKMRPDGFGGRATLIAGTFVRSESTDDLLESYINEAKLASPDVRS